jgi:hypothetical protein
MDRSSLSGSPYAYIVRREKLPSTGMLERIANLPTFDTGGKAIGVADRLATGFVFKPAVPGRT